ncbi:uncharacterized protein LOC144097387 isoform X2 [Amblyomma americanum]
MDPENDSSNERVRRRNGEQGPAKRRQKKIKESKEAQPGSTSVSPMIKLEKHSVSWVTLVCALILFVIVVAALTALVARQLASRHANSDDVCGTENCVSHGRAVLAGLNLSVDPCVNFYQYVCGHVAQGIDEDRVSVMYARKVEDYIRYRNKPGADNQGVGARLEAMFTLALDLSLQRPSVEDPTAFVEFMRERGLRWPYGPELPDNRTEETA